MSNLKRLYIFTGKGGVGKTTCAFSFAKYLKDQNIEVEYAYIANSSISSSKNLKAEFKIENLKLLPLDLKDSVKDYVKMKLKSDIVSSLVVKAPFFKSLISMIPGFNYLIYLGKIMHRLEQSPNIHIIFDSPSSGHAITMLKVVDNFLEIFKSGSLYDDTQRIKSFLFEEDKIKINIISLPNELAQTEAIELKTEINKIDSRIETQVVYNNILAPRYLELSSLPNSLKKKIENEQNVLANSDTKSHIPHSNELSNEMIVANISPFTKNLV